MSNKSVRQAEIRRFIYKAGQATVAELCARFEASEATIRRDLGELADQGVVQRTHGGAARPSAVGPEPPILQRTHEQAEAKALIGKAAAELVADGETVFLGSGTTTLPVARHLQHQNGLTVISNSLPIIDLLADNPDITLIVPGGLLRHSERSMIGHLTEQAIAELRADKVIMGVRAMDLEHGLTNDYLPETMTDRAIVRLSNRLILVADHTKFGQVAPAFVAPLSAVHTIVTDPGIASEVVQALVDAGIQVIVARGKAPPPSR
jgi:DeoR/GlpR family transcriptional regulator of sugar metabolism